MHVQQLLGRRSPDPPTGALLISHKLLARGGYIRQIGQGIFTLLPLGTRVARRIEAVLRAEMDSIGGQEMLMPVVAPAALWRQSGRYDSVGSELVRFRDRVGQEHVLSMTHEEAVVDAVAANLESYRQLPLMVYQIQTKFRDEPRSRGGLIRVREFTMKDAYSFHRTQEDLEQYYQVCHRAYDSVFERLGLTRMVSIESDVGMMGGRVAHEFMFLSEQGEDHLIICPNCDYRANREIATFGLEPASDRAPDVLTEVHTPDVKTIEDVASFLGMSAADCCRANALMADEERPVLTFVRGDLAVSYAKVRNQLRATEIRPMHEEELAELGIVEGFIGPLDLPQGIEVLVDETIARSAATVVGANKPDAHLTGFRLERDHPELPVVDIAEAAAGLPCPRCGTALTAANGIEVGNIFQLGTKYTDAMDFTYAEEDGGLKHPIMGCYGIGVGRSLGCIVEEHHDENGPIWPMDMAPFQVAVCCIQAKRPEVVEAGRQLFESLEDRGVETILDDRTMGAGFIFADADLIAAPVRAIVSPRNLKQGVVELGYRTVCDSSLLPTQAGLDEVADLIVEMVGKVRELDRETISARSGGFEISR